jgi:putative sugar O-methyltransferase
MGLVPTLAHYILQIPFRIFAWRFKQFSAIDKVARNIARCQNRQYDLDLLRHTLTLAFLEKHLTPDYATSPVCIIGDGYANMSSVILGHAPQSRVVLVNLAKSLMVDLVCLKKAFPEETHALVRTKQELQQALYETDIRIILICANDAQILKGTDLSLAINIESMMEMDPPIIEMYFDLLRSTPKGNLPFYCCNLEHKQFSGEGTSCFHDYPWQDTDEILVHELCPWTKYRYGNTPPFFSKRTPDLHRLAYLCRAEK